MNNILEAGFWREKKSACGRSRTESKLVYKAVGHDGKSTGLNSKHPLYILHSQTPEGRHEIGLSFVALETVRYLCWALLFSHTWFSLLKAWGSRVRVT